jgi:hypothetical protein
MSPSHSAAAAAAAAAAGLSSSSLPPLSRLLPPPSATIESGNSPMQPVSHVVTSKVEAQQTMQPHSDYYHSPVSERGHQQQQQRQVPSSGYPYPPSEMPYRKSIDSSRPVYPPTVPSSEIPRRNYVASQEVPNNYYLVQQQPAEGGPPAGYPTHPPTVPSSNLPMFQAPPSSLNNYHRAQPPQYHLTSHHSMMDPMMMDPHGMHSSNSQKVFSFVPLPGLNQKKRPRRKYHEVERLYQCNYQDCSKAYGTLNHLNAHVSMQKHVSNIY